MTAGPQDQNPPCSPLNWLCPPGGAKRSGPSPSEPRCGREKTLDDRGPQPPRLRVARGLGHSLVTHLPEQGGLQSTERTDTRTQNRTSRT